VSSSALRSCALLTAGLLAGVVGSLRAQAPATENKLPAFDVASVKRNITGSIVVNSSIAGGRYVGTNLSVMDLLAQIYRLPRSRFVGGPGWISTTRFDIVATFEGTLSAPEILDRVHALLNERFRLVVHTEKREGEVYDLVLARNDGQLGPMLRPSNDCRSAPTPQCGSNYPGKFIGSGVPLIALTSALGFWTDQREVRDRTGLTGFFDIQLTWAPDRPLGPLPPNAPDEVVRAREAIDWNGPSLFTAVQEQLGLKLESKKDQIDVLVIDRLEMPTEN